MKKYIGRLGVLGAVVMMLMAMFSAPAQAAANPYTRFQACAGDFGGSWSDTTDGHRNVLTPSGSKWGDVYLMYNSATGYNCVVVLKSTYLGTSSRTVAGLLIQGESNWRQEAGNFSYYAAVQGPARDKCVQYDGFIWSPSGASRAHGARYSWGNCG
ncbi:hypothetical protein [Plantactinospora sp. B24E8]|uniref:hypothetical protein n=1 Tax=Plantactinospora sp. B24E8 TaxID=3153567 RepID=UPI00325E88D0